MISPSPLTSSGGGVSFTGISQYASTFQSLLNTAVQTAGIPITELQSQDSVVLSKESALGNLQSAAANLTGSLNTLTALAATEALSATSSNSSVVTATATGATAPASYTINSVTSLASAASEVSTGSYGISSPVSSNGTMTLAVGSQNYTFNLRNNNLQSLADAINSQNAGVTASILTTSGGNYLSVSANQTGATTLKLFDGTPPGGADLLTLNNQGSNAQFQLDGITVTQSGNTVNDVIPGVTFTLAGKTSSATAISVASDPSQLSSALQGFVADYNALQNAVQAQEGLGAGPLAGNSVIGQLQTMLNQIASYTNLGGAVQSLADLGVQFNSDTGQLSFDQTAFASLTQSRIQGAFQFLGTASSGFGAFYTESNGFSDPLAGLIQSEITGDKKTDSDLQKQVSLLQAQVAKMQSNLTTQFELADARQQELENQQSSLQASLTGLNLVLYGRNNTTY